MAECNFPAFNRYSYASGGETNAIEPTPYTIWPRTLHGVAHSHRASQSSCFQSLGFRFQASCCSLQNHGRVISIYFTAVPLNSNCSPTVFSQGSSIPFFIYSINCIYLNISGFLIPHIFFFMFEKAKNIESVFMSLDIEVFFIIISLKIKQINNFL